MNRQLSSNSFNGLFNLIIYTLLGVALAFLICTFVIQRAVVVGDSMEPNYHNGESKFVDKITYTYLGMKRFNVIVCKSPLNNDELLIKRVIALPGEKIQITENGDIYINDELLQENYGKERMMNAGIALHGITLGDNQYFVLGDNRNNSADSRLEGIGPIDEDLIIGRIINSK